MSARLGPIFNVGDWIEFSQNDVPLYHLVRAAGEQVVRAACGWVFWPGPGTCARVVRETAIPLNVCCPQCVRKSANS